MDTLKDFIARARVTATCERVDHNPNNKDWKDADHWRVRLRRSGIQNRLTIYFSQGYGHNGKEPDVASVLSCLADDSSSADQNGFEEWCGELGYDTDSLTDRRKAERIYNVCQRQAARLKAFLGDDLYERLLNTERA